MDESNHKSPTNATLLHLWVCRDRAATSDTPWEKVGYRLAVDTIAPYEEPKKQ